MTTIPMRSAKRLFVLGATGGTGKALVEQALERGHQVTAFARAPEKLGPARERLSVVKGDPHDVDALKAALPGHAAVLTALGPPGPGKSTLMSDCARTTVEAMKESGVDRIVVVSAAVLFENEGFLVWLLRNTLLKNIAKDSAAMEAIVSAADLAWTIVRPPRLTHGRLTSRYAVANGHLPAGRAVVSRADVAHFVLDEVERGQHAHQIVGMSAGIG